MKEDRSTLTHFPVMNTCLDQLLVDLPAKRVPRWDRIFLRKERGFAGADADRSIALDTHRSLWVFGDTLIGDRNQGPPLEMPRNTVGILSHQDGKEKGFEFFWRTKNGRPYDFFPPVRPGEWLWPGTAAFINNQLYFFLNRFQTDSKRLIESFRFQPTGFHVCRVANAHDHPMKWEIHTVEMPPLPRSVYWAAACLADRDGYLYLWGHARGLRTPGTLVARCPLSGFKDNRAENWEYWGREGSQVTWKQNTKRLQPIIPDSATEMSLHYLEKQKIYLTVYGPSKTNFIGIRIARSIMGPWSRYQRIYTPPELSWNPHYFCYAPKAHPELTPGQDQILITYITDADSLRELYTDPRIYFPRFISLRLSNLEE